MSDSISEKDYWVLSGRFISYDEIAEEAIFPRFNIPDVFTEIITGHDLADGSMPKPHPHMALEIMRKTGIAKEATVMVGDAKNDVLMTQRAGITPIVVLTGHLSKDETEELGVEYIISDVTKVPTILPIHQK